MAFIPQNFKAQVGPAIKSVWLNALDVTVNSVLGGAQTVAAALSALGLTAAALITAVPVTIAQGGTGVTTLAAFLASMFPSIYALINPQTAAEATAGIVPTNYSYPALNVFRYGATGNGVTDDTAAIVAANAVAAVSKGTIIFPTGNFKISASLASIANDISWTGAGPDATVITMAVATQSGFIIGNTAQVTNNCFISNMTIASSGTQTAGSAIEIMNAGNCGVRNVRFGPNLNWALDLDAATPAGVGGFSYLIEDCEINSCVNGIVLGTTSFVQDIFMNNVVIDGATGSGVLFISASGVYLDTVSTAACAAGFETFPGAAQNVNALFFTNCLSDTTVGNAWNFITNGGEIVEVMMTDCWGSGAGNAAGGSGSAAGVSINQGSGTINGLTIQGGIFHHNKAAGIALVAATNVAISGTQVYQNSFVGASVHSGIEVSAGVSGFAATNNILGTGGYFGVVNVLPNNQAFGIAVAAGASNNYVITNNVCLGNVTSGVGDGGAGPNKIVTGNVGYNPFAKTAVTVTGSPFTFTNDTGSSLSVAVQGGTVSTVVIDGLTVGAATNNAWSLPQGQSITVTYSVAPTMAYLGLQ